MPLDRQAERGQLEKIAESYTSLGGYDNRLLGYRIRTLLPLAKGPRVLEVGCADGGMTETLVESFRQVVALDSSESYVRNLRHRLPHKNLEVVASLLEDFRTDKLFDTIFASHILEHVYDPVAFFLHCSTLMVPDGCMLVCVPNAYSFHRRLGKVMGVLTECTDLSETDHKIGHRRVYTMERLCRDVEASGLLVKSSGGISLKPLSNRQMETWDERITDGLYELAKELPEWAAQIYVRCVLP